MMAVALVRTIANTCMLELGGCMRQDGRAQYVSDRYECEVSRKAAAVVDALTCTQLAHGHKY